MRYAVDTNGDGVHFFHNKSNSISLLVAPVHAFGIIARTNDTYQFRIDSVYEKSGVLRMRY